MEYIPGTTIEKPSISSTIDGNAFAVMGACSRALRKSGAGKEVIDKYTSQAMSGDYDNLLRVTMDYCNFDV